MIKKNSKDLKWIFKMVKNQALVSALKRRGLSPECEKPGPAEK